VKKFETEVRLSREMTLLDATLIGVGAMIGAGIFVLIGIAAGVAGPALILAFVLSGIVAFLTAMSYAELGSCFHDAGGGYLWAKEGLPKWNGFLAGWMSWFAHAVACSVYALGFGAYFDEVLREMGTSLPHWGFLSPAKLLAVAIAIFIAYVNFRGASETGKLGNIVTMTKIFILGIFVAFGLHVLINRPDWTSALTPFMVKGWNGVFSAMGLTFIAFEGYEVIAQCSEEIRNPKKNIPRAIFLSLLIVIPIYILVAITSLVAIQPGSLTPWDYMAKYKETALVQVAKNFFIGGGIMLLIGGLISTVSALNATVFSSSRVAFAMGRDRNFPSLFSKVHRKNATPHWAIIVSLLIIVLMAVSLPIEDVASAASIMFLLLFLQVNVAMIRLRKKRPDLDRGFIVPLFPVLTIAGILMLLLLAGYMVQYSPIAWVVTAAWIGVGLVIYRIYASKREIKYAQKVRTLERLESKQYRILVALSKSDYAIGLNQIAMAIAHRSNSEIIFLHVIEVPEGKPLSVSIDEQTRATQLLHEVADPVAEAGFRVRTMVRVSHRISEGIVETAEEEECNFIVLARQKHLSFLKRFFSSAIDSVIQQSPCEVAVLHGVLPKDGARHLLLPFGADIHTQLAAEITPALINYFHCKARVAVVFEPNIPSERRGEHIHRIQDLMTANNLDAELEIVHDSDILMGVIQKSRTADLVVMGGRRGDVIKLLFGGSLGQEITEGVDCPVLWVTEYEEKKSFWATLFQPLEKEVEESHG
jgi:amino acid transporter/nucleotide-binding universal stress UspA family protein